MAKRRILFVEDDVITRTTVADFLDAAGYVVDQADTVLRAELMFRSNRPDAILADYNLPDANALDLLQRIKRIDPGVPVVVLTGNGSVDLAVRAMKEGADNFLTKPVELPALAILFERLIESDRQRRQVIASKLETPRPDPFLGTSAAIRELRELATTLAASDSSVLLLGETGSGKGVLARWIHEQSARSDEAFVNLNCAGLNRDFLESELFGHERGAFTGAVALKQGLLEVAHRGTLFLDEIGDVDGQVQPKLLKVLEEKTFRRLGDTRDRKVDIRLIAATHQHLRAAVRAGRFRNDLYFRISTVPLQIPPLRERKEDIPAIAAAILSEIEHQTGRAPLKLGEAATAALVHYSWPGNVRELRNSLERATILSTSGELKARHLVVEENAPPPTDSDLDLTLDEVEMRHIQRVLDAEGGSVERAAKRLGIPRSTLYYRLKQKQGEKS